MKLDDFMDRNKGRSLSIEQLIAGWCFANDRPLTTPPPSFWWNGMFSDHWQRVEFSTDKETLPGDIVMFEAEGEIQAGIFIRNISPSIWEGFGVRRETHTWAAVLGWFTPKAAAAKPTVQASAPLPFKPLTFGNSHNVIDLPEPVPVYRSKTEALTRTNADDVIGPGKYFVYRELDKMLHLTLEPGKPVGTWINPLPLPDPEPIIEPKLVYPVEEPIEPLIIPPPAATTPLMELPLPWHVRIMLMVQNSQVLKTVKGKYRGR